MRPRLARLWFAPGARPGARASFASRAARGGVVATLGAQTTPRGVGGKERSDAQTAQRSELSRARASERPPDRSATAARNRLGGGAMAAASVEACPPSQPWRAIRPDAQPWATKRPDSIGASPTVSRSGGPCGPPEPDEGGRTAGARLSGRARARPDPRAARGGLARTGCARLRGRPVSRAQRGPRPALQTGHDSGHGSLRTWPVTCRRGSYRSAASTAQTCAVGRSGRGCTPPDRATRGRKQRT